MKAFLTSKKFLLLFGGILLLAIAGETYLFVVEYRPLTNSQPDNSYQPEASDNGDGTTSFIAPSNDTNNLPSINSSAIPSNVDQQPAVVNPQTPIENPPAEVPTLQQQPSTPTGCTQSDQEKAEIASISKKLSETQAKITETNQRIAEEPNNPQLSALLNQQVQEYNNYFQQIKNIRARYAC